MTWVRGHWRDGRWVRAHSRRGAAAAVGGAGTVAAAGLVLMLSGVGPSDLFGGPRTTGHDARATRAVVTSIVDGDTLRVRVSGDPETVRVRLLGIDAPEIAHEPGERSDCYGDRATQALEELAPPGTRVLLTPDPSQHATDRYGRQLRYVAVPAGPTQRDVALMLLEAGAAQLYSNVDELDKGDRYTRAAKAAERANTGLWGVC